MLKHMRIAWVLALVACKSGDGGSDMDLDGTGSAAKPTKSGFSAALADDKKGSATPDLAKPAEKPVDKPADKPSGLAAAVGSDPPKPPEPAPVAEKPAEPVKAAEPPKPATEMKPSDPKVVTNTTPAAPTGPIPAPPTSDKPRVPAKVSPEQAAIKLSLDPNWDRDIGEPGTISFVLRNNGKETVFSFAYGIDPATAPNDRDAYVKWLADQKILNVELNRQRGGAWYLQGTDASGAPAFRYLVNFGGKKLVCGGLLYKDAASNALGDLRDKVIIQAKEICETLAL